MAEQCGDGGQPVVIGWREDVALPDWCIRRLKAKADTGARTSAIDVDRLELLPDDRVRFELVVDRNHPERRVSIETDIVRMARIRSSLGQMHERPIVRTTLRLAEIEKSIELGLVCRRNMLCRMLLGRRALAPEFRVDPSRQTVVTRRQRKRQQRRPSSERETS